MTNDIGVIPLAVKIKTSYLCQACGGMTSKWVGMCPHCQAWNTLVEEQVPTTSAMSQRYGGYAGNSDAQVTLLADVPHIEVSRIPTDLDELDRVLGGGIVPGSVVLLGGDPGIGKSTLLLQTVATLAQNMPVLYITGEESLQQVSLRAKRLELPIAPLQLLTETSVERIIAIAKQQQPSVMVIDSIQTMYTEALSSAPGGIGQVRESAAQLVRFAKQTGTALFLVGHVTKEGALAGPRVLEHMVDAVLYFEGESDNRFRMVRAIKNRFGAVNELGVFAMTERGLRPVTNPSAIFLSRAGQPLPGSCVMVTWEGSRPLLVEVQALVDDTSLANPRRVSVGLEQNRLAILLAVLHRHGRIASYNQDVFVNVVGGVRLTETAVDLALLAAILSSQRNRALPMHQVIFGEVGLAGEIRPVQNGQERLREAAKHGFTHAIVPAANAPKKPIPGMEIHAVNQLSEALALLA